jgi:hypothetical protein
MHSANRMVDYSQREEVTARCGRERLRGTSLVAMPGCEGLPKVMFSDALITRNDLPRDAFQFIRACAYDHLVPKEYRKDARKILTSSCDLAKPKRVRIGKSDEAKERDYIEKQLDDLARELCFARDGHKCIRCGNPVGIQWAHVKTRGVIALRWDLLNNMTLCGGCHLWWHNRPDESGPWFKEKFPERWLHIQIATRNKASVDRKMLVIVLRAEVKQLSSGV